MSKQAKLFIGVVVTAVVLLLLATITLQSPKSPRQAENTPGATEQNEQTVESRGLPIGLGNPAVSLLLLSYSLNGDVVSVTPSADGVTLVIASQNTDLPPLPLTKVTEVIHVLPGVEGEQEKATIADIKTGANVNVAAVYNTNTKEWVVHRVNLLPNTTTPLSPQKPAR